MSLIEYGARAPIGLGVVCAFAVRSSRCLGRLRAGACLFATTFILAGCLVAADHQIIAPGQAITPTLLRETYFNPMTEGYLRFLRVSPSRYAVESFSLTEGSRFGPIPARIYPLESDVFVIEILSDEGKYSYGLVRISKTDLQFFDIDHDDIEVLAARHGIVQNDGGDISGSPSLPALKGFFAALAELAPVAIEYRASDDLPIAVAEAAYTQYFASLTLEPVDQGFDAGIPDVNDFLLSYLRILHDRGERWASYSLARLNHNGVLVAQNYPEAKRYAETAIAGGLLRANNLLAIYAQFGTRQPVEIDEALRLYRVAADAGEPWAMYNLARLYLAGEKIDQDISKGIEWLQAAGSAGLPHAAHDLGLRYRKGEGLPQNDALAFSWFEKGANGMNKDSQAWLGWMLANGRGASLDQDRASSLYLSAAQNGQVWAQWQIGERLIAGTGVSADRLAGLEWLRISAEAGRKEAKEALARYETAAEVIAGAGGNSGAKNVAAIDAKIADVDSKLAELNARQAALDTQLKELCGGRVCMTLSNGREIFRTESYDPPLWYFRDGRLAPREMWPK